MREPLGNELPGLRRKADVLDQHRDRHGRPKHWCWAIGTHSFTTSIRGIPPMKLHRELDVSQKAARFMLHRLRNPHELGRDYSSA